MSGGPVVCETTTDKSRDTGPYLPVYVVKVILPTKTCVEKQRAIAGALFYCFHTR